MSLSVALNQNIAKGIDTKVLREVTQEIFKRAEAKNADFSSLNLTHFNRPDIGMDLYEGGVDATTARKVAIANSGIQVALNENVLASIKFLNSEASKNVFKAVEGKVAPAINETATEKADRLANLPKFTELVKTTDLGKDKQGSNPFYKGELLKAERKQEKEEVINIFA